MLRALILAAIVVCTPDGTKTVRSKAPVSADFTCEVIQDNVVLSPGSSSWVTTLDRSQEIITTSSYTQQYTIVVRPAPDVDPDHTVTFTSNDPGVASTAANVVSRVSDGSTTVTVSLTSNNTGDTNSHHIPVTFSTSGGSVAAGDIIPQPGSVREEATDAVMDRLAGATKPLFSTMSPTFTRSTTVWTNDLDTTGIPAWSSTTAGRLLGALVTPRHVLTCAHGSSPGVGATLTFVTQDGTLVTRTVVRKRIHPSYSPYYPDFCIMLLDEDLPETITPVKVLPHNWTTYLPTNIQDIPALALDQERKALVNYGTSISVSNHTSFKAPPTSSPAYAFYETKISGDSGSPAFLIIDDTLVLLTVWTFGGAGSGTSVTTLTGDINALITAIDTAHEISTGYQLTPIDLSSYNSY